MHGRWDSENDKRTHEGYLRSVSGLEFNPKTYSENKNQPKNMIRRYSRKLKKISVQRRTKNPDRIVNYRSKRMKNCPRI